MARAKTRRPPANCSSAALVICPAIAPPSRVKLSAGGGNGTEEFEWPQVPVNASARADALDDLLAQIAAFAEVKRPHLRGLLRQVALGDVDAVCGNPFGDAKSLKRCRSYRTRAGLDQSLPQRGNLRCRHP